MNEQTSRLIKLMDEQGQIRIYLADTQSVVQEAARRHGCSATAAAALGRTLTAACMMSADLKAQQDLLTVRIKGDGPAGEIVVTAAGDGSVRGYILNPKADLPSKYPGKLDVGGLVGHEGILEVIRDMGLEQPFIGRIELVSGEIAEDIAQYFYQSEQIPSLVSLGVLVNPDLSIRSAEGLFIQALPNADEKFLQQMEEQIQAMGPISAWPKQYGSLEQQIEKMMGKEKYTLLQQMPLQFRCNCSHERLRKILSRLNGKDIQEMLEEGKEIEVVCHFCGEKYHFAPQELIEKTHEETEQNV